MPREVANGAGGGATPNPPVDRTPWAILGAVCRETGPHGSEAGKVPRGTYLCHLGGANLGDQRRGREQTAVPASAGGWAGGPCLDPPGMADLPRQTLLAILTHHPA